MSDTIAAIATGAQLSAIGIVRLSGDDAIALADALFRPQSGKPIRDMGHQLFSKPPAPVFGIDDHITQIPGRGIIGDHPGKADQFPAFFGTNAEAG